MKKVFESIGLIALIGFSFFYSDKVMMVVKEQDNIMIKLKEIYNDYKVNSVNAYIENDTIIPGVNGKKVDIDLSYKNMKEAGIFDSSLIVYKEFSPKVSIKNNLDKYIVKGNNKSNNISLIMTLEDDFYYEDFNDIINNKNVIINLFLDYHYLNNNINNIKKLSTCEIYNYGDKGSYTPDNILFANNIIENISSNTPNYCLTKIKNKKILSLCKNNNMYTIIPNVQGSYIDIKSSLDNGNIILLEGNNKNINELNNIIDFIRSKGFNLVGLSQLLSENL